MRNKAFLKNSFFDVALSAFALRLAFHKIFFWKLELLRVLVFVIVLHRVED